jgi:hypothetical protein
VTLLGKYLVFHPSVGKGKDLRNRVSNYTTSLCSSLDRTLSHGEHPLCWTTWRVLQQTLSLLITCYSVSIAIFANVLFLYSLQMKKLRPRTVKQVTELIGDEFLSVGKMIFGVSLICLAVWFKKRKFYYDTFIVQGRFIVRIPNRLTLYIG